ncbi:MAG TPA: type II secretion system protein [Longimicrobium sp.]|nr:type II secretion system protein [Longimicrobium sp.]
MSKLGKGGFTLLEAVFAMTVVGLAAVATLAALAGELRSARRAREALVSTALAEARLETMRLLNPDELRLLPDSVEKGTFAPPFDAYRWEADADVVPGETDLYGVEVRVAGPEGAVRVGTRLYRPSLGGP